VKRRTNDREWYRIAPLSFTALVTQPIQGASTCKFQDVVGVHPCRGGLCAIIGW
jgi:hypothetical protein